jgi:type II secretory ATPase GspE/PulE/Tfp pilus assembly ATPase PilB-like protein
MRFHLTDPARARRIARLLQRELSAAGRREGLTACLETAARLYGYASFTDLKASLATLGSPFDADAGPGVAETRRAHQLAVLASAGIEPELGAGILDRMRPTGHARETRAGRDQVPMGWGADALLARAVGMRASDIHIEPRTDSYAVFFRCLGERHLVHMGPLDEHNLLVARLKDRSRMDLAERRIGQDGGFQVEHSGRPVDLRVATVPAVEGEQVIIRILDPDRVRPKLEQLGISRVSEWKRGITRKSGLCLICGETGSGKTTTLNASVRELDRFGERDRAGEGGPAQALPAEPTPHAVRGFLDARPDVMVLGELRDAATARHAVRAATAGNLVVATLHGAGILPAIARLRELGVEPGELRPILGAVLAQTLVKVVCRSCGGRGAQAEGGCTACSGRGYADRTAVSECVAFGDASEAGHVLDLADRHATAKGAGAMPWTAMLDDAIAKMGAGVTTSEELARTFGAGFERRCADLAINPAGFTLGGLRVRPRPGAVRPRA